MTKMLSIPPGVMEKIRTDFAADKSDDAAKNRENAIISAANKIAKDDAKANGVADPAALFKVAAGAIQKDNDGNYVFMRVAKS